MVYTYAAWLDFVRNLYGPPIASQNALVFMDEYGYRLINPERTRIYDVMFLVSKREDFAFSKGAASPRRERKLFADIQAIKERLNMNIEFARPEDFVPPLRGSADRHLFIDKVGPIAFHHYDPYAQLLSKVVRGFNRDMLDASSFVTSGMVDPERFRSLVNAIPEAAYAKYPAPTPALQEESGVRLAVGCKSCVRPVARLS